MTGSGTKENPYIIENFNDLLNISGGSGTYYLLGTDIDINDTSYAAQWSTITINCSHFDGGNHTIKNIFLNNSSTSTLKSIFKFADKQVTYFKNINLENIYINGGKSTIFSNISSYNVYFSGINLSFTSNISFNSATDLYFIVQSGKEIFIENSSINCLARASMVLGLFRGTMTNCHINADITYTSSNNSSSTYLFSEKMLNTAVFANISSQSSITTPPSGNMSNCYFVLPTLNHISRFTTSGNIYGTCFYDKDVAPTTTAFDSNIYALSTENCKNTEYLKSIGFIVEGE